MQIERKYYFQKLRETEYVITQNSDSYHNFFNIKRQVGWRVTPISLEHSLAQSGGTEVSKKWLLLRNIPLLVDT